MNDLAEFLLARYAEDEERARAALGLLGIETEWHRVEWLRERGLTIADARHIAQHDPARVLAECEAKRQIVGVLGPEAGFALADGGSMIGQPPHVQDAVAVLQYLALPYAGHPDYRQEWRP